MGERNGPRDDRLKNGNFLDQNKSIFTINRLEMKHYAKLNEI